MTGYAESDFDSDAVSAEPTNSGYYSEGVFQQTLPWWTNDHWDVRASAKAFINKFRKNAEEGDAWRAVKDCHDVQRWRATPHRESLAKFLESDQTRNYVRRLDTVTEMIKTGRLP